jgi:hypothetical protein
VDIHLSPVLDINTCWLYPNFFSFCCPPQINSIPYTKDPQTSAFRHKPAIMLLKAATLMLAARTFASPFELEERQGGCPNVHVFGARETTVSPGYGTAGVVVNLVLNSNPGSNAEAIVYPACGGQASCGGQSYAQSALAGTAAVASAVNSYNTRCPNTKLVLVGYSQVSTLRAVKY